MSESNRPAWRLGARKGLKTRRTLHQRRRMVTLFLAVTVTIGAMITGYALGRQEPVQATVPAVSDPDPYLNEHLNEQKDFCEAVERINLEQQLDQERTLNHALAESLEAQQEALEIQQEEMQSLESRVLSTLMGNFSDQLISRSNSSVDGYIEEANNLIDLSRRLNSFKESDDADEIDLAEYEQALENRLQRIPTLRPTWGRMSSGFGYRIHPIRRYRHFHSGVDLVSPIGTAIRATATGYVQEAGYNASMGNYIKLNHGNGFQTVYMHCNRLHVSRGESVQKGQTIATVGNTGTSTGPHLHYEVHLYGNPVNPTRFFMQ